MGRLSYFTLREYVEIELSQITLPDAPVRRIGAEEYKNKILLDSSRGLDSIDQLLETSIIEIGEANKMLTSIVNELTSFLYAIGASHDVWKHWSSLTAFGLFLSEEFYRASQYATLGSEWEFLKFIPDKPVDSQQQADLVTWMLISNKPNINLSESRDEYSDAWLKLARSIPNKDHKTTEESLKIIANFWMKETGGDWNNFYYGRYPVFETPICAVAALARHQDFAPMSLTSIQYSFLEAGLAQPEPPPMFPKLFSLPVSAVN